MVYSNRRGITGYSKDVCTIKAEQDPCASGPSVLPIGCAVPVQHKRYLFQ
ncbi:hypothetical protein SAMN05660463_00966 [Pseudomonas sp. URIL14HWK12:I9]|nr:hypothetical protein F474_00438 [Pseudomonas sp. URIL14HWK12:I12]PVZ26914.1 hypothetical protein F470_00093 [Pseudomonas sp. URIL14HWK12:I10]PVZ37803.1 hypothetical protein F472_00438 [Pseudomonas sp. URIL14HWK12:I11]SNZ05606.1 hypothetical protein SAMN05660463_00966 [Pseudomonas sp. URIL14HWK12:I9]